MSDYLNIHIQSAKMMMKIDKKTLTAYILILVLNIAVTIIDYHTDAKFALGMMAINIMWLVCFVIGSYGDYKQSKKMLHFYEERRGDKNLEDAYDLCDKSRQLYEKAIYQMQQIMKAKEAEKENSA